MPVQWHWKQHRIHVELGFSLYAGLYKEISLGNTSTKSIKRYIVGAKCRPHSPTVSCALLSYKYKLDMHLLHGLFWFQAAAIQCECDTYWCKDDNDYDFHMWMYYRRTLYYICSQILGTAILDGKQNTFISRFHQREKLLTPLLFELMPLVVERLRMPILAVGADKIYST